MKSSSLVVTLAALALLGTLGGCSTVKHLFGRGEASASTRVAQVAPAENKIGFKTDWQARLYGAWRNDPYQTTQVAVSGHRIVVGDSRGNVHLLSTSGREIWDRHIDTRISTGATIVGDRLYVGTDGGEVVAMSLANGKVLWRSPLSSEVLTRVVPTGDSLVVQTNDGKLWSINAQSGASQLLYSATIPTLSLRGIANPLVDQGVIYAAFANGELAALDAKNGTPLWQVPVATPHGRTELERIVDADATPVIFGSDIIAGTYQGKLASFKRSNGSENWSRDMSVYNPLLLVNNRLYLTDADGHLWAIDPHTGATLWRSDSLQGINLSGPVLVKGTLLVAGGEGYLYAFDPESGRLIGRGRFGLTGIQSAPTPYGKGGLLLSREGTLYRFNLAR